jgi:hypothetical protein
MTLTLTGLALIVLTQKHGKGHQIMGLHLKHPPIFQLKKETLKIF